MQDTPGDVFAYDVRTGALRWTFHAVPREGEFGADYADNAFVTEWGANAGGPIGRVVLRVILTGSGASERGQVSDFARGFSHPLAITVAPDGGLLVGDYGTGQITEIFRTS